MTRYCWGLARLRLAIAMVRESGKIPDWCFDVHKGVTGKSKADLTARNK